MNVKNAKYITAIILTLSSALLRGQERTSAPVGADPPGIANVIEYHARGPNGVHLWSTNMTKNWWGTWIEDTNTGWRVLARFYETNTPGVRMTVHVGSVLTNSGPGLLPTPNGKFAKLELWDPDGKLVPAKPGAALAMYEYGGTNMSRAHPQPSRGDTSVAENHPSTISDTEYPRWKSGDGNLAGRFVKFVGFVSNGPPCHIGYLKFNDIYSLTKEADYTLAVQPVLYRMHYEGGTFQGYLDCVDLPNVITKVHLVPSVK